LSATWWIAPAAVLACSSSGGEPPTLAPRPATDSGAQASAAAVREPRADAVAAPPPAPPREEPVETARAHFENGRAAYREGRLKDALVELQRAYALAPSAELAYDLGRVCERLGEADLAIAYFSTYRSDADLPAADRADVDRRIEALRALHLRQRSPLLQPPPSSAALDAEARAFFMRGIKLFGQGHYAAALAAFEAAYGTAAPAELAYDMALTAERLGRLADAIDYYREYLRKAQGARDAAKVQAHIEALERQTLPPQPP
jgi:tetratricopeptide (TPR) repeat protein